MRFVPVKTPEQQSGLMLHRTRHLFIRQQTSVINAIRAHLAEFGVTAAVGRKGIEELLRVIADPSDKRVPDVVRTCLAGLGSQLLSLKKQILDFDRMIMAWHRSNQTSKRLNCIPGVGPLLATALVASAAAKCDQSVTALRNYIVRRLMFTYITGATSPRNDTKDLKQTVARKKKMHQGSCLPTRAQIFTSLHATARLVRGSNHLLWIVAELRGHQSQYYFLAS
jgi:hypothetical protein